MGARHMLAILVAWSAVSLLAGCWAQPPGGPAPDDLQLTYRWREGSLPPPYHYSYSITLAADGAGEVTMVPDYPGEGVPVWTEPFSVDRAALDGMYATMVENGLLSERWRAESDPPIGGSSEDLAAAAGGRTVEIPSFVVQAQRERAEAIYAALREVVPAAIFADLEARRAAYEAEHSEP
ncbi:MAG TPA: hypothetical protein PKD53_13025 [Chloroflexaceae bacterium]|nr:hypothetical protein [Chloroflexaceae bacterium]